MTEQFTFNKLRRDCSTVYLNKWAVCAVRFLMQPTCNKLFTTSVCTGDQNTRFRRGNTLDRFLDFLDALRITKDIAGFANASLKNFGFRNQASSIECIPHGDQQSV